MSEIEREPSDAERAEADALARALERGHADEALPEDALQAAALLRYRADGGALPRDREDAVLAEVLAAARRSRERGRSAPAARRAWAWLLGLGAAAAAALLLMLWPRPSALPTPALPAPDAALLTQGVRRLDGAPDATRAYEARMRAYRRAIYAALEEGYAPR